MGQTRRVGSHKTIVKADMSRGNLRVTYHSTDVVTVTPKMIRLNTGGYFTNTTRTRMNQASNQYGLGYTVYQKNYAWFVKFKGKIYPFKNRTLTLRR